MLMEVLGNIAMLNFAWLVAFVMENLMWLFMLGAIGLFIYGKNPLFGAVFVAFYLYATFDFANALGWVFRQGLFWAPMMAFIGIMIFDAFFGKLKWHSAKRGTIAAAMFYGALIFINVFLV